MNPNTNNSEVIALLAIYALEDPRPEPTVEHPWRHSPALPEAINTICEICNLQLHENWSTTSGWTIWNGEFR
jgi:hypothetical protein